MKNNIFEKVLNDVSLDPRIPNGTFSIEEETHMDVLREYLVNKGIDESAAVEFCNKVVEGKYPERQAYNIKGILVTFPTPEYKADAIKRGTHFEEDPTKRASNVFSDQPIATPPAAAKEPTKEPVKAEPKSAEKTTLPLSQADTAASETQPQTPTVSAPQPTSEPEEPPVEPKEPPPPPVKSTAEKEADKKVIKNILKGDDYMLESILSSPLDSATMKGVLEYIVKMCNESIGKDETDALRRIKSLSEILISKLEP